MKVNTFCKIGITAGAAALLFGSFAGPANADPASGTFGTLVGLGSDTTQDVTNAIAKSIGSGKLASYDAIGSTATVVTRSGGIAVPRVNGSGAGRDMLRVAIGQIPNKTGVATSAGTSVEITSSVIGQIDYARSSSGPGTDEAAEGVLTYVPFARDAVGVAVDPTGPLAKVPFYVGSATDAKTEPTLYNVYRGYVQYAYINTTAGTYNSVGETATAPAGTTAYKIQPILPKFGSGTRSYFVGQLGGGTDVAGLVANTWTTVNEKYTVNGVATDVQEHEGAAIMQSTAGLPANTYAIGPFSIAQYVAQTNGIDGLANRTAGVTLPALGKTASDRVATTTGSGKALATNTAYAAMVRNVYNIIPSKLADDATSDVAKMFVGANSTVCQQTAVIQSYGFLPASSTGAGICGYKGTRAFPASASSASVSVASTTVVGSSVTATATVNSVSNGGGTVRFMTGDTVIATASIAANATTATATIATSKVGSLPVKAVFIPALAGVASSTSGDAVIDVTAVPSTQPPVTNPPVTTPPVTNPPVAPAPAPAVPTATAASFSTPKLTIGKTASVTVAIVGGDAAGGTVTLKNGTTVLGTAAVAAGTTSAVVKFVPSKTSYALSATYAPKTGAVLASSSSIATAKAAKGAATVKVSKIKAIKAGKSAKVTVKVSNAAVTATGTVTIKEGKKTLATKKLVKGKVTITVKKLKAGSHKLTVTYKGNTVLKSATKTGSLVKVKA